MYAQKGNKVYNVNEQTKAQYLADGFDIVDDSGKVIENAPGKTVPYAEYKRVSAENARLTDENAKLTAKIKKLEKSATEAAK